MKISYYLPETVLTNEELSLLYPEWPADKIYRKTGIHSRHISDPDEFCSDMAVKAANKLFEEYDIDRAEIEFIVLATQSSDYALPTTACIIQDKLGIKKSAGALDINLGCSAFIYGLSLAKAMVCSGTVKNVLFITSEMYSKRIRPMDKSTRTIFGDGAAAVFIDIDTASRIGAFVFGTDGSGYHQLIVPESGMKGCAAVCPEKRQCSSNDTQTGKSLYMNGTEIFNFAINIVPLSVNEVLKKNCLEQTEIDMYVFHQANKFMLDYLRTIIKIPKEKFFVDIENVGNTVSSSIPIALKMAEQKQKIKRGDKVLLVGFGVGLSWGAVVINY